MAFPPQFSSTETYANRYDLDEIDVFLDGDSSNPMFFNITGLPRILNYGKHYFTISILDSSDKLYRLRDNSRILFEFKSINNVILRSDIAKVNQQNGMAVCFVEVLRDPFRTMKEIEDGEGTLTVVGSLDNNETINSLSSDNIPEKFIEAMNYRCTFPIEIRKNANIVDIPFIINPIHELCTLNGQFSFIKASIAPPPGSGMKYKSTGDPSLPWGGTNPNRGSVD